jgi:hypothetical protein
MKKTSFLINVILTAFAVLLKVTSVAQHQEIGEKPGIWKNKQQQVVDTNSILYAFKHGTTNGHLRYFFMNTNNADGLTDYYAHAAGGGIKFETAGFKGFQLGISGFFTFNMGSSDLSIPDPKTNQYNRYEIGLFDQTNPNNKNDIDRLEELFLKYNFKKGQLTIGKQLMNTPFINMQDGRMRPTEVGGAWAEINSIDNTKIEGGLINQISPRGTVEWFGVGESIGVYSSGVNTDGTKSNYANNTASKGIAMIGLSNKSIKNLSLKFWNLYTENIFNAMLLQADLNKPLSNGYLVAGIQFINTSKVGNGGNAVLAKRYMQQDAATTFGGTVGWENKAWKTSINFNRISGKGRYLMPREWGRDPFYTFMSRERNEGLADANAYVLKLGYTIPGTSFKTSTAFGYFDLPEPTNYKANKYGMPSYHQINLDIRYDFKGLLSGLGAQLLYVYKSNAGKTNLPEKYIINKVDMNLWNLVFNYNF